jgi:hypothetical protein
MAELMDRDRVVGASESFVPMFKQSAIRENGSPKKNLG